VRAATRPFGHRLEAGELPTGVASEPPSRPRRKRLASRGESGHAAALSRTHDLPSLHSRLDGSCRMLGSAACSDDSATRQALPDSSAGASAGGATGMTGTGGASGVGGRVRRRGHRRHQVGA
jgi:hypothetical protein